MNIEIVWGASEGQTALSAFDAALADGGIHNYNLVPLSSVIPKGATIAEVGEHEREWDIGELVSVILAENKSTVSGEMIAAGLGWAASEEGGIFFEAEGESADEVDSLIRRGITSAKNERPEWTWRGGIETRIVEHQVVHNGAAIVSAIYRPI